MPDASTIANDRTAEEWRLAGRGIRYEYEVSSRGRVRRADTHHIRAHSLAGKGYPQVSLGRKRWRYVHDLVTAAFIGPKPTGLEVNHKDGDKQNNRAANLEYVTKSGNARHAHTTGLTPRPPIGRGSKNVRAKLCDDDVRVIRAETARGVSKHELATRFAVSLSTIYDVLDRTWGHL